MWLVLGWVGEGRSQLRFNKDNNIVRICTVSNGEKMADITDLSREVLRVGSRIEIQATYRYLFSINIYNNSEAMIKFLLTTQKFRPTKKFIQIMKKLFSPEICAMVLAIELKK